MPIDIYEIENLFWNNNSYRVPNNIPSTFKRQRINLDVTPTIFDREGGEVRLVGGNGNWCRYQGEYYFLKKAKPLDRQNKKEEDQVGMYHLIRCHGTNIVLKNRIKVFGDLITWKHEELLKENLNRCLTTVTEPASIRRVALHKTSFKWQDQLTVTLPKIEFHTPAVIQSHWLDFIARCNGVDTEHVVSRYKVAREYLHAVKNHVFILASLKVELKEVRHWKELIKQKVVDGVKGINSTNTKIYKVTSQQPATSNEIVNNYCISRIQVTKGHLGNEDTTQTILKIDLSNLTDIKKIRLDNLQEDTTPNKPFDTKKFIVEDKYKPLEHQPCWKVCRKIYLPGAFHNSKFKHGEIDRTNNKVNGDYVLLPDRYTLNPNSLNDKVGGYFGNNSNLNSFSGSNYRHRNSGTTKEENVHPGFSNATSYSGGRDDFQGVEEHGEPIKQVIEFKPINTNSPINTEKGFLYGLDRVDFALSGKVNPDGEPSPQIYGLGNGYDAFARGVYEYQDRSSTTVSGMGGVHVSSAHLQNLFRPHTAYDIKNYHTTPGVGEFKKPPCFGFLLFQIDKEGKDWNTIEYEGTEQIKRLKYYSGFSREGWKKYGDESDGTHWFGKLDNTQLGNLSTLSTGWLGRSLSRFLLCLDGPLFRYFTPDFYEYDYRYDGYDIGEMHNILTSYALPYYLTHITSGSDGGKGEKMISTPYKNEAAYETFNKLTRKHKFINPVVLKTSLELPDGFEINKGDYFFSSLEYELRTFNHDIGTGKGTIGTASFEGLEKGGKGGAFRDLSYLGDQTQAGFTERGDRSKVTINDLRHKTNAGQPTIVLTSNLNTGKLEIRTLQYFQKNLELNDTSENVVDYVDGYTNKELTFYKLGHTGIEAEDLQEEQLLATFMKIQGLPYDSNSKQMQWFDEEDLTTELPKLFDLVGTPWFVLFRGPDLHLILKKEFINDPSVIEAVKETANLEVFSIRKEGEQDTETEGVLKDLKDLPLLAKINQINTVHYRTVPRFIKSKFLFEGREKLVINVRGLQADQNTTHTDNFGLTCKTDGDHIEELIQLSKKPTDIKELETQIILDNYTLSLTRADEDRELQRQQHDEFAKEKINTSYDRAVGDLNFDYQGRLIDMYTSLASTGVSLAGGAGISRVAQNIAAIERHKPSTVARQTKSNKLINLRRLKMQSDVGLKIAGTTMNLISKQVDGARTNEEYTEMLRRLEEDKQISYKEVFFANLHFDVQHFRRKQDQIIRMNEMNRTVIRGVTNDMQISEKIQDMHGTGDMYMTIQTPNEEQMKTLEAYTEEYGVDCYIPNTTVILQRGMEANVIRFKNLEEEQVYGINDITDREIIISRLHIGIKIIDTSQHAQQIQQHALETKKDTITSLTRDLQEKITDIQKELQEEQERINELEQELTKKEKQVSDEEQAKEQLQKDKTALESEIGDIKKQLEESKNKHNQLQELYNTATSELTTKTEEIQQKDNAIQEQGEELKKLTKDTEDLKEQLKKCTTERVAKEKAIADKEQEIEVLKKNLKQQEEDNKGKTQEEIQKLRTELEEKEKNLTQANNRANNLHESYEKCNTELTEQKNLASLYKAEADKLKGEKRRLENRLKRKQTEAEGKEKEIREDEREKCTKKYSPSKMQHWNPTSIKLYWNGYKDLFQRLSNLTDDQGQNNLHTLYFHDPEYHLMFFPFTPMEYVRFGGTGEFLEGIRKTLGELITTGKHYLTKDQTTKFAKVNRRQHVNNIYSRLKETFINIIKGRLVVTILLVINRSEIGPTNVDVDPLNKGRNEYIDLFNFEFDLATSQGKQFPRNYSGSNITFDQGAKYLEDNTLIRLIIQRGGSDELVSSFLGGNETRTNVKNIYKYVLKKTKKKPKISDSFSNVFTETTEEGEQGKKELNLSQIYNSTKGEGTPGVLVISSLALVSGSSSFTNSSDSISLKGDIEKLLKFLDEYFNRAFKGKFKIMDLELE